MSKITDLDQNLIGGNDKTNLVGDTSITVEPLELKAKSVLQILKNFRSYILEHAVKGDTGATGLSIIGVSLSLTSSESTGNTYKMTCTLSDMSTINAGTFFVPKGDKGDTGDTGATGNGILNIVKTGTAGLVDSYTINFTNGSHFDYTVTNGAKGDTGDTGATGNGIASITKTGTVGLVDTYRITFTNGAYFDYTVTNGAKGDTGDTGATGNGIASIEKTGTSGLVDTYTITYTNGTTTTFTVTNGQDGAGTEIYVNGVAVSSVSFTSDPQTQITNLGTSKQDKIDSSHKLSADLVEDGTTNKVFTATEQTKLNGIEKGAEVNDLEGVQINGTDLSISGKKVNIVTNTAYNATSNKIATMSDLPPTITITTTSGSQSVSDGTNTLNFGSNAFNSTLYLTQSTANTLYLPIDNTYGDPVQLYSASASTGNKSLSQSMDNFRYLYFEYQTTDAGGGCVFIPVSLFKSNHTSATTKLIISTDYIYCCVYYVSNTQFNIQDLNGNNRTIKVYGIE